MGSSSIKSKGRLIYPQESFINIPLAKWEMLYSLESYVDGNIWQRKKEGWYIQ